MKNRELIHDFIYGATEGKAGNLQIKEDILYSYSTAIAQRIDYTTIVNESNYSQTTKHHQNILMGILRGDFIGVYGIPKGTQELRGFLK